VGVFQLERKEGVARLEFQLKRRRFQPTPWAVFFSFRAVPFAASTLRRDPFSLPNQKPKRFLHPALSLLSRQMQNAQIRFTGGTRTGTPKTVIHHPKVAARKQIRLVSPQFLPIPLQTDLPASARSVASSFNSATAPPADTSKPSSRPFLLSGLPATTYLLFLSGPSVSSLVHP